MKYYQVKTQYDQKRKYPYTSNFDILIADELYTEDELLKFNVSKSCFNEFELEELNEKYQKRTKYNIIAGKDISKSRYYTLAELKEIYGAQTVNLNFPYMVLQNIYWDNPLILYVVDMKTLKFDTINGKTNTYQVKEA